MFNYTYTIYLSYTKSGSMRCFILTPEGTLIESNHKQTFTSVKEMSDASQVKLCNLEIWVETDYIGRYSEIIGYKDEDLTKLRQMILLNYRRRLEEAEEASQQREAAMNTFIDLFKQLNVEEQKDCLQRCSDILSDQ